MSQATKKLSFKPSVPPVAAASPLQPAHSTTKTATQKQDGGIQVNPALESDASDDIYSNDPLVQLEEIKNVERIKKLPPDLAQDDDNPVFGKSLDWAYRGYIVHRHSALGTGDEQAGPLNNAPPQPVNREARAKQVQNYQPGTQGTLCLFNVIVACEWQPTESYIRQLKWGFRRASDFLYDVTDGRMAFGQVVLGGPELMHCADIQILASNRLHPRSWVGGLHNPKKYTPIRVGRGNWPSRNGISIPWDEPESYRTLIHEWSHYALELRDQYFERRRLIRAQDAGFAYVNPQLLVRSKGNEPAPYTVVIPRQSSASESIMATLEGTSELVPRTGGPSVIRKSKEWAQLTQRYTFLEPPDKPLEGPGRFPLPLPLFRRVGALAAEGPESDLVLLPSEVRLGTALKRYSVYVVRYNEGGIERVIAQGMPDARFQDDGLRLLGARRHDTIVLVGTNYDDQALVYSGQIAEAVEQDGLLAAKIDEWLDSTPHPLPTIAVIPDEIVPEPANDDGILARVSVQVSVNGDEETLPADGQVWLFPLGETPTNRPLALDPDQSSQRSWISEVRPVTVLDGHVLVRWGREVMICNFSHGGNPPSSTPVGAPPITAGSTDGTVMLFFDDDTSGKLDQYSQIKVITTIDNGAQGYQPQVGARAWGYPFSVVSNAALPLDFCPTLIVRYDTPDEREMLGGNLLLCRLEGQHWVAKPTYMRSGSVTVAMPLNEATAGSLFGEGQKPLAEHYQLYWCPHDPANGAS